MILQVIYLSSEIDVLDVTLHELNDVVDKFIILEFPFDFSGANRRMYYNESKERFKKFENKIIHLIDDSRHGGALGMNLLGLRQSSPKLMGTVFNFADTDFVAVCDGDVCLRKQAFLNLDITRPTTFRTEWCQYWINAYCPNASFDWAFGAPIGLVKQIGNFATMIHASVSNKQYIPESGWHWSKMGGAEKVIENTRGYPHQEYAKNKLLLDPVLVQERIDNMWGWDDVSRGTSPISWKYNIRKFDPNYYPKYVGDNLDIFSKYIKWI